MAMRQIIIAALADLATPWGRRWLWRVAVLAVAVMLLLAAILGYGLLQLQLVGIGWLDTILDFLGAALALLLLWVMLPGLFLAIAAIVQELMQADWEKDHGLVNAVAKPSWKQEIAEALGLFARLLKINLICLPLYFIPLVNFCVYLLVNGYFLAQEYLRLLQGQEAKAAWAAGRRHYWLAGMMVALLGAVPGVQLFVPIFALRLFDRLKLLHPVG